MIELKESLFYSLFHKLKLEVTDFQYRRERYNINYSIAIGYVKNDMDMTPFKAYIRASDRFVQLDSKTSAVILDCADDSCGVKVANKLLNKFQGFAFGSSIYSAIVTASNYNESKSMLHELFFLLDYAIKNNTTQLVLEPSQLI